MTGVDSSLEMLRRAKEHAPDARLVCADARDVEFQVECFDRIVAWDSLFHAGFRIDRWEVDDPSSRGHIAAQVTRPEG